MRYWIGITDFRPALALILVIGGCTAIGDAQPRSAAEDLEAAPEVLANGAAGVTISYCRPNYCADGGIDFRDGNYPTIELPITLTFEQPPKHIAAHVTAPGRDSQPVAIRGATGEGVPFADELTITALPLGDWPVLAIDVGFEGEVSIGVVWAPAAP